MCLLVSPHIMHIMRLRPPLAIDAAIVENCRALEQLREEHPFIPVSDAAP